MTVLSEYHTILPCFRSWRGHGKHGTIGPGHKWVLLVLTPQHAQDSYTSTTSDSYSRLIGSYNINLIVNPASTL